MYGKKNAVVSEKNVYFKKNVVNIMYIYNVR